MHLYWRVIEELKYLGEVWTFTNPSFQRWYERWLRKNADAIAALNQKDSRPAGTPGGIFKRVMPSMN